ncbi:serine/threonine-protein kinase [Streptomyces sp. NPDC091289]|uniref:serine/threonine-protein kinase n=1 Tax=Streptomyces sp. NPDC091289 TaxID=3365989 RepID=UPI00380171ED
MDQLSPEDPTHIGPYRLIARLGAGGMGRVYLARSEAGRTVAVKVVQPEYAGHPEFRKRFAREVVAARRVGGTWTAAVLGADTDARVPWVATQYVPGLDLHTLVTEDFGPLPEPSVRVLAHGLAQALGDIHAAGLIHRDLKPSNVLVTVDGPRVIDFGIARALGGIAGDSLRTRTGMLIGSPGFMSPEQVRGLELGPASDVFCLGAVLAHAATGRLPFGSTDSGPHAQIFRVVQEDPDLEGVPEGLLLLIRECLDKDPAKRPTPQQIAERTATAEPTTWLPGKVLAQLGRHAAQLLDFGPSQIAVRTPTALDSAPPHAAPPHAAPPHAAPTHPAQPPVPAYAPVSYSPQRRPGVPPWRVLRLILSILLAVMALAISDPAVEESLGIAWTDSIRPHGVIMAALGAALALPVAHRAHGRPGPYLASALTVAFSVNVFMLLWHLRVAPVSDLHLRIPGLL